MEGKDTASQPEETEGKIEVLKNGKPFKPRWININVKMVDGHYLVTFRHDEARVFHNMEELLMAIEAEVNRLGG